MTDDIPLDPDRPLTARSLAAALQSFADGLAVAPADRREAAPPGSDPHADATRRAADGFVRWARQNPEAADRAMAANPFPPAAGGSPPAAADRSQDNNYLRDLTQREHVRVQHGPHGIIYLLDHPNKRFVLVGGDPDDDRVAALVAADRERFAAVGWLLHLPPGVPVTPAERAEYRRLVADGRYDEALRRAGTPAGDPADAGGNALLELELIGGVLGLACRMCRDFADRHPGDTDPCRSPGAGRAADPNGIDQFRRWVRTVTAAGAECGWASADLHAGLPSAVVFADGTPPAVALDHLARLAREEGSDEPPSPDWLRRVGFAPDPSPAFADTPVLARRLDERTGLEVVALLNVGDGGGWVVDGWRQRIGSGGRLRPFPDLTTRRRVRGLFAAFDNPLPAGV